MTSVAEKIIAVLHDGEIAVLPGVDVEKIIRNIGEIDDSEGINLDIWGLRERVSRDSLNDSSNEFWGFSEADFSQDDPFFDGKSNAWLRPKTEWLGYEEAGFEPFDQAPAWDGDEANFYRSLSDDEYRIFVEWYALANISDDQPVLAALLREFVEDQEPFIGRIAEKIIAGFPQRYGASSYIISLLRTGRVKFNSRADVEESYKNVWDIDVAVGNGLDAWGQYVGASRQDVLQKIWDWFGFSESEYENFGGAPFWDGETDTLPVPMGDDDYRLIVLWKLLKNVTAPDQDFDDLLPEIFGGDEPEIYDPEPEPEPTPPPDYPVSPRLWAMADPTVQSQYSASERILALVRSSRVRVIPEVDLEVFYKNVFDIDTASGYGLDVWGRIVGVSRYLPMPEMDAWFGFSEADFEPFGSAPMWDGLRNEWAKPLADDEFRTLILWKALANISTADAASLNHLLQELFAGKELYAQESFEIKTVRGENLESYEYAQIDPETFGFSEADYEPFGQAPLWDGAYTVRIPHVMSLTLYVFFDLLPHERAILEHYGLLAKGAGVRFDWVEIPQPTFGFAEAGYAPFDSAPFWGGGFVPWNENEYKNFGFFESNCQPFGRGVFYAEDNQ